jgi:DNA-directed RNA polymerase sigma subunit (sigma70/sigma32)
MAPQPERRGPAGGARGGRDRQATDPSARDLRALAQQAEGNRSDPEQEARLLRRAAGGDGEAETRLFNEYLGLVIRLARGHVDPAGAGLNEDELIQEGSIGLIAAIRSFPESGAADFQALVADQVSAQMAASQREQVALDRAAAQLAEDAEAYERAEISVRRQTGRAASNAEIAEKLEWTPERTTLLGEMVKEARRQHDEGLLEYLDPERLLDDIEGPGSA